MTSIVHRECKMKRWNGLKKQKRERERRMKSRKNICVNNCTDVSKCQYDEISMACLVSHIMEEKIAGCINGWLSPGKCRRHSLCDKHAATTSTTFCLQTSLHSINNKRTSPGSMPVFKERKNKKRRSHACPQAISVGDRRCVLCRSCCQVSGCWEDGVLFVLLLFAPGHQVKFPHKITVFPALCSVHLHLPHIF